MYRKGFLNMSGFEWFKGIYPRREAWKDAEKAWKQINGDLHQAAIAAALEWQVPMFLKRERHHVPLPATYLRGERWTDENPGLVKAHQQSEAETLFRERRRRVEAEQDERWRQQREQFEKGKAS
jgi:hypothetical protein